MQWITNRATIEVSLNRQSVKQERLAVWLCGNNVFSKLWKFRSILFILISLFFVRYLQRQLYSKKQHSDPKVFVTQLNLRYVCGLSRTPWLLYCRNSRLILFCWGIYFISHTNVLQVNPRTLAIKAFFSQWIICMFTGLGTPSTGLRSAELCH